MSIRTTCAFALGGFFAHAPPATAPVGAAVILRVVVRAAVRTVVRTAIPGRLVLDRASQDVLTAEYERSATGDLAGLRLAAPARTAELTLRYLSAEVVALPPEAFHLALPADVRVQPFD